MKLLFFQKILYCQRMSLIEIWSTKNRLSMVLAFFFFSWLKLVFDSLYLININKVISLWVIMIYQHRIINEICSHDIFICGATLYVPSLLSFCLSFFLSFWCLSVLNCKNLDFREAPQLLLDSHLFVYENSNNGALTLLI